MENNYQKLKRIVGFKKSNIIDKWKAEFEKQKKYMKKEKDSL